MALKNLLSVEKNISAPTVALEDITKDRIKKDLPQLRKLIAYWRVYPDKFVDYLCSLNPDNTFKFFFIVTNVCCGFPISAKRIICFRKHRVC